MNQEVKTQWLKALRSEEYKQGKNGLITDGRYCCLGVLCDLYAQSEEGQQNEDIKAAIVLVQADDKHDETGGN